MDNKVEKALKAVIVFSFVCIVLAVAGRVLSGCGSNIPIEDSCSVPEECVEDVVDNYCPFDDSDLDAAYNTGYTDGQESVKCEECPPPSIVRECFKIMKRYVCRDPETGEKCDTDWWPRECGWEETLIPTECPGEPVTERKCDRNCDPNDPICIPCDLEEYARRCYVTCIPTGNGGTICKTECFGVAGAAA